jgi:beta-lactamase class A
MRATRKKERMAMAMRLQARGAGIIALAAGIVIGGGVLAAASVARPAGHATGGHAALSRTGAIAASTAAATATSRTRTATPSRAGITASPAVTAAALLSPAATVREGICTAPVAYKALAAKLSAGIQGALKGREGDHAVTVYDRVTGVDCLFNSGRHFDSASVVKTIILAALLRWHQETGTPLSATEQYEATLMITQSDNDAATYLWDEVGMARLQHFLNLAKMSETELGQDGYWGLTQITAHDEMLLLRLLTAPNTVLSSSSRSYELGLMAKVISSQRWGTPAGAPSYVTVHVKNGWLPDDTGWHINSTGAFTGNGRNYMMVVLTDDNPTEDYGIDTIQAVARLVHRDINAAQPKPKKTPAS